MSLVINEEYRPPAFVYEGQRVVAPYVPGGKLTGLRCVVVVAAGNHARVVNEKFAFDRWFQIDHLRTAGVGAGLPK